MGAGDTDRAGAVAGGRAGDGAVELATETQRHRAGSGDESAVADSSSAFSRAIRSKTKADEQARSLACASLGYARDKRDRQGRRDKASFFAATGSEKGRGGAR